MKYFYYTYTHSHRVTGREIQANAIATFEGEFKLAEVHEVLAKLFKETCIVQSFFEISQTQYNDFANYCNRVEDGRKLPQIVKLVPVQPRLDG